VGEFGNKFRKARQKKELSFDDVSNVTKIGSRMLQAIEEERFDRLPGGIFNKGFIRAYAKHLGLNDEDAITDYLACLRQTQIDAQEVSQPEHPGQPRTAAPEKPRSVKSDKSTTSKPSPDKPDKSAKSAAKSSAPPKIEELPELQLPRAGDVSPRGNNFGDSGTEIPWRMLVTAAIVIFLVIVLWMRRSHRTNTAAASSPASAAPSASTRAFANPASSSLSPGNAPTAAHSSTPIPQPLLRSASTLATHSLVPAPAAPTAAANKNDNHDTTAPTSPTSNPASSEKPAALLTLIIRATENSWISVLADGQPVSHETLIAPARTSVRASREIIVKVGNAAGVNFLWNGQEIPPDGAEAEVKTYVFDSNGMRSASATSPPAQ
jgi:cytoskeletal protein RodZ